MIDILDHILIAVRDLKQAEQTYTRILGRLPTWKGEHPGLGSANLIYRLRNTYLEFVEATGEGPFGDIIRNKLEKSGEGLLGLAFGTVNADLCVKYLRGKGLNPTDPLPGSGTDADGQTRAWRNIMLKPEETGGLFMFIIEQADRLALPLSPLAPGVTGAQAAETVDHVVIETPEPDAAITFYKDKLGLRLALDHTIEKWGVRQLFFRFGGITLEIITPIAKDKQPTEDNLWGMAYRCPNVESMQARLKAAGATMSDVTRGRKKGTMVATIKPETHGIPTILIGPDQAA